MDKQPSLAVLNSWFDTAKEFSKRKNWERFVIDQFLRGNHDIKGNAANNSIEIVRKKTNVSYPVNLMFSTFRAVRGFVTRHRPYILVEPENSSEEAKQYARRANKILERDNQLNNFRKINKEWVYYGIKYGVGYRQVGYDPIKKCCIRWTIDPCDLFVGSKYGEMEDAPYIIKTVTRTVGYIKNKYPKTASDIAPDNELAADDWKKLSLQISYSQSTTTESDRVDDQTVIVKEAWYYVFDENKAGGHINKCTFVENSVLDHEETPYNDYPFIPYKSDVVPNEAVGEGHMKHILSPQRMLNLLNNQLLEYNHIVNKGRFIRDKNSGFSVINSVEGQIITKNRNASVQVLNPPSINPLLQWQIGFAKEQIQNIGGQQDASMGRLPSASLSGDAIENLQQADSNNIADCRDNFEDALALEAQWILKLYSMFESEGVVMSNRIKDEEEDVFAVVGSIAAKSTNKQFKNNKYFYENNGDYVDVCQVLPEHQVKVSVQSQLGETREAKMDLLLRLLDAGIPLKVVLEHLEFPNTSDIMERIADESLAEMGMQMMNQPPEIPPDGQMAPPQAPPAPPPPPPAPQGVSPEAIAQLESIKNNL